MSRVAKASVVIPSSIEVKLDGNFIVIKGKNGELNRKIHQSVKITHDHEKNQLIFTPRKGFTDAWAQAGTTRSLLNSMIMGVTKGFTKQLQLVGIGYRAAIPSKGNSISLSLGFSHQIEYTLPVGITAKCPSQTEIVLEGADKQVLGQVAAELRAYRRPEPYKGKGVRYIDEIVRIKETKKK